MRKRSRRLKLLQLVIWLQIPGCHGCHKRHDKVGPLCNRGSWLLRPWEIDSIQLGLPPLKMGFVCAILQAVHDSPTCTMAQRTTCPYTLPPPTHLVVLLSFPSPLPPVPFLQLPIAEDRNLQAGQSSLVKRAISPGGFQVPSKS
jgi:hypothetical protein